MADKEETNAAAAGEVMPKENGDGVILDSPPANPAEEVETGTAKETPEVDGVQQLEDTNGPGEALADAEATASPVMGKDEEQPTSAVDADAAKDETELTNQGNLKRPREEDDEDGEDDEPDRKRASNSMLGSAGQTGAGVSQEPANAPDDGEGGGGGAADNPPESEVVTETMEVQSSMVGKLIGRNGETIRQIQVTTDTRINVDHSSEGPTRKITITGYSPEAVSRAKEQILALESVTAEESGNQRILECPPSLVGRIIGRGGETIRALQAASEAHITVNQDFPPDHPRELIIQGPKEAIDRAVLMINELMHGEPGSAQAVIQRVCAQHNIGKSDVVTAPKMVIGRIIGRGGETVKQIQKATGATIQIDQSEDPCRISLAGQPAAVEKAKYYVTEIANGGDPFAAAGMGSHGGPVMGGQMGPGGAGPPPGGFGAPGGPYGGGYGGYGGPYGGGYGGSGYAAPAYGAYAPSGVPGAYGGYPPQGAYPGGYGAADPYAAAYGGYAPQGGGDSMMGSMGSGGGRAAATSGAGGGSSGQWVEYKDDQGRPYYHNPTTGTTQWEKPVDF